MQNNQDRPNRFIHFFKQRGYILLLAFCAAAAVIAGVVFLRAAVQTGGGDLLQEEVTLSVPVKPEGPAAPAPQAQMQPKTEQTEPQEQPEQTPEQKQPEQEKSGTTAVETSHALVVRPVAGVTSRGYSMDKLTYSATMRDWRTHDGIDIVADQGAPVRAAMDGVVSAVYDDDFLGTTVELTHADGTRTVYANLMVMPTVKEGDYVTAGSVIGAVGATAMGESAEGTHLHFAVVRSDVSCDPETLLP